jgi:hypothetical protein
VPTSTRTARTVELIGTGRASPCFDRGTVRKPVRTARDLFSLVHPIFGVDVDTGYIRISTENTGRFSAVITHKGSTYEPLCVSP